MTAMALKLKTSLCVLLIFVLCYKAAFAQTDELPVPSSFVLPMSTNMTSFSQSTTAGIVLVVMAVLGIIFGLILLTMMTRCVVCVQQRQIVRSIRARLIEMDQSDGEEEDGTYDGGNSFQQSRETLAAYYLWDSVAYH